MTKEAILEQNVVGKSFDNLVEHITTAMQQYASQECAEKDKEIRSLSEQRKHWVNK